MPKKPLSDDFIELPLPGGGKEVVRKGGGHHYDPIKGEYEEYRGDALFQNEDMRPTNDGNGCLALIARFLPEFIRRRIG